MTYPAVFRRAGMIATPVLAWLALPGTFSWWPLLLVCLVPLMIQLDTASSLKAAFWAGLTAGFALFMLTIYWIVTALMQFGHLPWYLAVPALMLLALYLGFYTACFSVGFWLLQAVAGPWLLLTVPPALWVGLDWLRSWLFSGFPWMDLGYGLWSVPLLFQGADLAGHHGGTFLIVLVNCLIFVGVTGRASGLQWRRIGIALLSLALLLAGYSTWRWQQVAGDLAVANAPVIGIVQGNIDQGRKWSADEGAQTVATYLDLSRELVDKRQAELVVWPETALPFYPRNHSLFGLVQGFVRQHKTTLLTGAPWYEIVSSPTSRLIYYFNSALMLPSNGSVAGSYYKSHLVPFGEYVPLQRYLPFLAPVVEAAGNFTPGRIEQPLESGAVRAGVLICFESIFPELGRAWVEHGANVLVNLTNDAWYGKSSAPYQSWAMSVFRAVETRRSLVRSANTGISGIVDPLGRTLERSPLFAGWASARPVPLMTGVTPYVRGGYLFGPLCGAGALVVLIFFAVKRPQRKARS